MVIIQSGDYCMSDHYTTLPALLCLSIFKGKIWGGGQGESAGRRVQLQHNRVMAPGRPALVSTPASFKDLGYCPEYTWKPSKVLSRV